MFKLALAENAVVNSKNCNFLETAIDNLKLFLIPFLICLFEQNLFLITI